jgi:hypothetical protein
MAKYLAHQYATTNTKRLVAAVTRLIQEVYGKDSLAGEIVQYDDITELHELLQQNVKIRKSIDWVLQEDYHSPAPGFYNMTCLNRMPFSILTLLT